MELVLLLALASQLPFTTTSPGWLAGPTTPAAVAPAVPPVELRSPANDERLRQLFANTTSVMSRRGHGAWTGRALGNDSKNHSPPINDDQIAQATYKQNQNGASPGADKNATRGNDADGAAKTPAESPDATDSFGSEPAIDDRTRSAANASATLLASALIMPDKDALEGRPVSLAEALGRVPNSSQRLEVASLYWKLALALADYHWALDESMQLTLPPNGDAVGSPLLATAQAAAGARMLEAKAAAVTVQQELADALGQSAPPLPLTVEQPLVGPYRTEFDSIFANRAAPGRSRAIHGALPHWREAIDLRTAAVQAANSAVQAADAAYGQEKAGTETVLFAHRELAQQRRAFLNAVRAYNAEIVEYASYVAGPATSTATIVSMLTRSKPVKSSGVTSPSTFGAANEPTVAPPEEANVVPAVAEEAVVEEAAGDTQ